MVYPPVSLCGFGRRRSPLTSDGEVEWIGHGIGLVATYARSKGFDIDVLDMRDLDSWEQFALTMEKEKFDVVGISISYIDYKVGVKAIGIIRKVSPNSKIVVGGFVATIFPEQFLNNPDVDYVVKGEGEKSFTALLKLLEHGMTTDKLIESIRPDLDELPFLDRSLFNCERESTCTFGPRQRFPHTTIIAGRGCPYKCKYCQPAESITYGKYRTRSVNNVISELNELRTKYKFKSCTIWDDTFTLNKKWVMHFCDEFERNNFDADLAITCRVDIACNNEDMIKRLSEIGVMWLCPGYETGTQRVLDFIGKGVKLEQNYRATEIFRKYGIKIMGTFMLGIPTESKDESIATVEMIKHIHPEHLQLFYYTPIPGTDLYDYCQENNLMIRDEKDAFNIERTGVYSRNIRGIDYEFLDKLKSTIPKGDCGYVG